MSYVHIYNAVRAKFIHLFHRPDYEFTSIIPVILDYILDNQLALTYTYFLIGLIKLPAEGF